jgi:hypothetical protein
MFKLNFLDQLKFKKKYQERIKAQTFDGCQVDAEFGQFRITTLVNDKSTQVGIVGRHVCIEQKVDGKWQVMKRVQRIAFEVTPNDFVKLTIEQIPCDETIGAAI